MCASRIGGRTTSAVLALSLSPRVVKFRLLSFQVFYSFTVLQANLEDFIEIREFLKYFFLWGKK